MTTLKVRTDAASIYASEDEHLPRQPTDGITHTDMYIAVRVVRAMFTRPNGSTDMHSWSKWTHSLNL